MALSIENLLWLNKVLGSLLIWHLVHSIVVEVPVQFEVFVLLTLRVESKASISLTEHEPVSGCNHNLNEQKLWVAEGAQDKYSRYAEQPQTTNNVM